MNIELSIVVVSWNCWEFLDNCIASIINNTKDVIYEIIVVDNKSADGTPAKLKEKYPSVISVPLQENIGFPKGNNIGYEMANGKYILALNPDTIVFDDTLRKSIDFLEKNSEYGCMGVKQLKGNGSINYQAARSFTTLKRALCSIMYLDKLFKGSRFFSSMDITYWDHENSCDIDMISGAYMMFPHSLYKKIGGLNDEIMMYFEDAEFCLRVWRSGYKIYYMTETKIIHYSESSSTKASPLWISSLMLDAFYLFIRLYQGKLYSSLFIASMIILFPVRILLLPVITAGYYKKYKINRFNRLLWDNINAFLWASRKIITVK